MTESGEQAIYCLFSNINQDDGNRSISATIEYVYWEPMPVKSEMEHAVVQCLDRGWLKILSEHDCQRDRLRWENAPHQYYSESPYLAGCVDFSPEGWEAYVKLAEKLGKPSPEERCRKRMLYLWRTPGCISIISMSQEMHLKDLVEVLAGTDSLVADGLSAKHTIGEIVGPYEIGAWWVKRFYLAPYGYRVDISFTPADMHF